MSIILCPANAKYVDICIACSCFHVDMEESDILAILGKICTRDDMTQKQQLKGTQPQLSGIYNDREYIPLVYMQSQKKILEDSFKSNGYIEINKLRKAHVRSRALV